MKLIFSSLIVLVVLFAIPQAFASLTPGSNTLENTELHGQSAVITLDIKFGQDEYQPLLTRTIVHPQLESISLLFYGDEIILSDPELRVVGDGRHFRIVSVPDGILIYGHQNKELGNYKINVLIATDKGFIKFPVSTAFSLPDDKVVETEPEEEKVGYVPDICMTSSHDFITYWMQNFDIDIQSFDCNRNSDPKSSSDFEGRLDGVDVKVLITLDDNQVATLSGVTANNGHWAGEWYFPANISPPGEYNIDVILSYLDQTITKSTTMFVINTVLGSDSSNNAPVADAGNDDSLVHPDTLVLDGTASSDPDGDIITYSWSIQNGLGSLSDANTSTPTYTTAGATTAIIQLTVTDPKGKSDTATVTITVNP